MELKDQIAVVTGAGRGIGRAVALELAGRGATVVLVARSRDQLEQVAAEIAQAGGQAAVMPADVADAEQVQAMVDQTIEKYEKIDILVNNAGVTRDTVLLRMKEADWDTVISVNLKSAFLCTKAVSKGMLRKRYGRIVNMTSVIGQIGNAGQSNYAASKAGLIGFTQSIARELASRNITVNAVAPGYIATEMTDGLPEKIKEQVMAQIPMGRMGEPGDVASLVGFLVGPTSAYITGQVFNVDGGMVM